MNSGMNGRVLVLPTIANNEVSKKLFRPKATAEDIPRELTDYIGSEIDGAVDYIETEYDTRLEPIEAWFEKHVANRNLATQIRKDLPQIVIAIAALLSLLKAFHVI